jgi:hypothetical protein
MTFNAFGFILTSTIAPITYLRSWALVVSVITTRFLVYQHPFLFETFARVYNNTFPFQQHFNMACDLLPPPAHACLLPFEQFIEQQMVQLQDSILEHLQHHTLSIMLFDMTSQAHRAQILSNYGLQACTWLITWLVFPTFQLSSLVFCITFRTWFGLPHPSIASILRCVCTHPINPMGIHLLCCAHGNEHTRIIKGLDEYMILDEQGS